MANNDIVGTNAVAGPADLYLGTFGATEPADTTVNTIPPSSSWTFLGGTLGGATINFTQAFFTLKLDQTPYPIGNRPTDITPQCVADLGEATLTNLSNALNGGTSSSGSGFVAYDPANDITVFQPVPKALLVHGWAPAGVDGSAKRRMLIIRKVLSTGNLAIPYKKDGQTMYSTTWTGHYVSGAIKPFHIVDAV